MNHEVLCLAIIFMLTAANAAEKNEPKDINILSEMIKTNLSYPINYDGIILNNNFDFNSSNSITIKEPIIIKNSTLFGYVNFNEKEFNDIVSFKNVTFNKKVDISNCNFSNIKFDNCVFEEDFIADKARFKSISLFNSSFEGLASFKNAHFDEYAEFADTKFRDVKFNQCVFNSSIYFSDSTVYNSNFDHAYFNTTNMIDFKGSHLFNSTFKHCKIFNDIIFPECRLNNISFFNSKFFKTCDFSNSDLESASFQLVDFSEAKFIKSTFYRDAIFMDSTLKNASFCGAKFLGCNTNFERTKFLGNIKFDRSQFLGNADFSDSSFYSDAYFRNCLFSKDAYFNGAKFDGDIFFDDGRVNGTIDLKRAKFNKIYIRINNIKRIAYDETVYKLLVENFKSLGFFADATGGYYRFMKAYAYEFASMNFRSIKNFNNIAILNPVMHPEINYLIQIIVRIINLFGGLIVSIYFLLSWALYGFGTRPDITLIWSLAIIMIFGFIWNNISNRYGKKIYDEYSLEWRNWDEDYADSKGGTISISDSTLFSIEIFLSGTKFFIDPPKIPDSLDKSTPIVSRLYCIERFLGGIFSLLFFVAIGSVIFSI